MRTALFAWELGGNLGHAFPMAALARRLLAESDVSIVVAGCELDQIALAFRDLPVSLLQAPVWPGRRHFGNQETQANYLDVLVEAGFADPGKLAAMAKAWRGLLDLVKPDLIVADHSPGLQVACHGRETPIVAIGTGYTMPPLEYGQFPPLRADRAPIMSEASLLKVAAEVVAEGGGASPDSLPGLFRTSRRFVFSFPELDPYRPMRQEPLYLPPEPLPAYVEPPVEPRLFVYLGAETPGFDGIVQALGEMEIQASAYLRGDIGPLADFLRMRGVEVYESPPRLADVLPTVSHVFHAGGSFTAHAALAAGRPQLILSLHDESAATFRMLESLKVAERFQRSQRAGSAASVLYGFIENHELISEARHWALILAARRQPEGAASVQAAIGEALA